MSGEGLTPGKRKPFLRTRHVLSQHVLGFLGERSAHGVYGACGVFVCEHCVHRREAGQTQTRGWCVCVCAVVVCFGRCVCMYMRETDKAVSLCVCKWGREDLRLALCSAWPSGRPAWGHG